MLEIVPFALGPVETNAYLVADTETGEAAVIDPAWSGGVILSEAATATGMLPELWYTHAHFDHIGGAAQIAVEFDLHRWSHSIPMTIHSGTRRRRKPLRFSHQPRS